MINRVLFQRFHSSAFTLHGQTMSYLIGAVAILHEASVISAVLPVKVDDL